MVARSHARRAAALALLLGLTACGSTVQRMPGATGGLGGGNELAGQPADGSIGGESLSNGQVAATAAGGSNGSNGSPAVQGLSGSASASPAAGSSAGASAIGPYGFPATGLGYDAKTLQIGVTTNKDAQATLAAVGVASGSLGDQEAITRAVLSDVNAQGGVLGRQVVPVFYDVKTEETSTDPQGAAASACAAFTQDAHVAAVLELVLDSRAFAACVIQKRAFVVSNGLTFTDQQYVNGLSPYFFRLDSPLREGLVPTLLSRLTALGYFTPWDTTHGRPGVAPVNVGLFYLDEDAPTRAFNDIAERLQAMGYKVTRYAYGRQDSSYENAVLKFRSSGVTHVIGDNGSYVLLMNETRSQAYYPRFGLTSYNGGGVLLQQAVPAAVLAGSLGVGWAPSVDVDAAHDPGSTGPAYNQCIQTMRRHNVDISTRAALAEALGICDGLQVMFESMRAGGGFDGPHITLGRARLSFAAAATFTKPDNQGDIAVPSAVRDYGFESSCSCFVYLSSVNRPLG